VFTHPRSSEGPSPETCRRRSGEWRPAAAARNQGPGRFGTPPARHYDLAARSSLHGSGRNAGDGSAAPDRKSPRWSAERRARPAGRAPRLSQRGPSRAETRDNRLAPFGAPLAPQGADGKETSKTRARKRAAGTREAGLFDMVNRNYAATHSVLAERAKSRACRHGCESWGLAATRGDPSSALSLRRRRSRRLEGEGGHRSRVCCSGLPVPLMLRDAALRAAPQHEGERVVTLRRNAPCQRSFIPPAGRDRSARSSRPGFLSE
jgi:hypothetical protein